MLLKYQFQICAIHELFTFTLTRSTLFSACLSGADGNKLSEVGECICWKEDGCNLPPTPSCLCQGGVWGHPEVGVRERPAGLWGSALQVRSPLDTSVCVSVCVRDIWGESQVRLPACMHVGVKWWSLWGTPVLGFLCLIAALISHQCARVLRQTENKHGSPHLAEPLLVNELTLVLSWTSCHPPCSPPYSHRPPPSASIHNPSPHPSMFSALLLTLEAISPLLMFCCYCSCPCWLN